MYYYLKPVFLISVVYCLSQAYSLFSQMNILYLTDHSLLSDVYVLSQASLSYLRCILFISYILYLWGWPHCKIMAMPSCIKEKEGLKGEVETILCR